MWSSRDLLSVSLTTLCVDLPHQLLREGQSASFRSQPEFPSQNMLERMLPFSSKTGEGCPAHAGCDQTPRPGLSRPPGPSPAAPPASLSPSSRSQRPRRVLLRGMNAWWSAGDAGAQDPPLGLLQALPATPQRLRGRGRRCATMSHGTQAEAPISERELRLGLET